MHVKEEPPSSAKVMAIMSVSLKHLELLEVPQDICLDEGHLERTLRIKSSFTLYLRGILLNLLKKFQDVFACSVEQMPGINPEIVIHQLNDPSLKPVCQKKRYLGPTINQAVDQIV